MIDENMINHSKITTYESLLNFDQSHDSTIKYD